MPIKNIDGESVFVCFCGKHWFELVNDAYVCKCGRRYNKSLDEIKNDSPETGSRYINARYVCE